MFPLQFPKPTGAYGIGTTAYHLIDQLGQEITSQKPNTLRELMVHVWPY